VNAVQALSERKPFFTARVAEKLLDGYLHDAPDSPAEDGPRTLTPREREVVQLLAEGKTSKEVAAILKIAVKTAETHRANVMHKLGAHSLSDVVRYAIRNRIIEP